LFPRRDNFCAGRIWSRWTQFPLKKPALPPRTNARAPRRQSFLERRILFPLSPIRMLIAVFSTLSRLVKSVILVSSALPSHPPPLQNVSRPFQNRRTLLSASGPLNRYFAHASQGMHSPPLALPPFSTRPSVFCCAPPFSPPLPQSPVRLIKNSIRPMPTAPRSAQLFGYFFPPFTEATDPPPSIETSLLLLFQFPFLIDVRTSSPPFQNSLCPNDGDR